MTKTEALKYLATCVDEFISEGFPVVELTGEWNGGNPCPHASKDLYEALKTMGFDDSAKIVSKYIKS